MVSIFDVVREERSRIDRRPAILQFTAIPAFNEVYGFAGSQGVTTLEGQLLVPTGVQSKTLFLFMHPTATLQLLPVPTALAESGCHVLCAASRYPRQDSALIMEKVAIDLGAWVAWAKQSCGYEKIILVGWSGGGALSLFYQSQAERPTITHTPAGDPVDLAGAKLIPADGVIFIAAHKSRAELLCEFLDPSIRDEQNPEDRDIELSIYDDECPNKPPFKAEFIARFRQAQIARSERITKWCQDLLADLGSRGGPEVERGFVVHRTMCDPRWIDPTVEPNDRRPNWSYLGDPKVANIAPAGLARYSSLRSWLSQWAPSTSNVVSTKCAPFVRRAPILQIENSADDAVPKSHNIDVFHNIRSTDKHYVEIKLATHYYVGQPELLSKCIDEIKLWATARNIL